MIANSLPQEESLCAPEKDTDWSLVEAEFMPFRDHFGSTFSWPNVRQSLERDGFRCEGRGNDTCTMMVLGVVPKPSVYEPKSGGPSSTSHGAIISRVLAVYRGQWRQLGPPSYRCREVVGKAAVECPENKPVRGERSGIYLVGEDWHMWGMFLGLFSKFE